MMKRMKRCKSFLQVGAVGALSIGILSGTGCTEEEIDAVLAGITIVADELMQQDEDKDISFGDWLADELSD